MLKELGNLIVKINFSEFTNIKFLIVFMSIVVKTTKHEEEFQILNLLLLLLLLLLLFKTKIVFHIEFIKRS